MRIRGRILNGKIVLEGLQVLPEGAEVLVEFRETTRDLDSANDPNSTNNVQLPLFHSSNPGSLSLSNQRIAEILEDEELSAGH